MARDKIHNAVKNALLKDGWRITDDPYTIVYKNDKAFVDLAAEHPIAAERGGAKIAVEIKSFLGTSPLREFEQALGQYRVYDCLLKATEPERKLYLAISDFAERRYFKRPALELIVRAEQLSLLIVNIQNEEIVRWTS